MKLADGVQNTAAVLGFLVLFAVGAVLQSLAMRGGELGVIYVMILGIEAAFAFSLGVVLFGESVSPAKVIGVMVIVSGIILLRQA